MTDNEIWNCETPVADLLGVTVPAWIEQDITPSTIASIVQGGCASGAYMPAVTYYQALQVMAEHGDDVLGHIEGVLDGLPAPKAGESWSGLACYYLSIAVEMWAGDILCQLESLDLESGEEA